MKKLIIGFFGSFLVLFFIWTIKGFTLYGENFKYYHLDLLATIELLNADYFNFFEWGTLSDNLKELYFELNVANGAFNNIVGGFLDFWKVINVPIRIGTKFINGAINVLIGVFNFIFYPVFI